MDEEARTRLIAQATLQNARIEIKRARANLSLGIVLLVMGLGISIAAAQLPLGPVAGLMVAGIGFVLIPCGLAVVIRAVATIVRANRQIRELQPPAARAVSS